MSSLLFQYFIYINLLFYYIHVASSTFIDNDVIIISGPTTIDQCGSIHLNIFSSLNKNDQFIWKYHNNNNNDININNKPQLFISNEDLSNITNMDNITIALEINNTTIENIMIEIDKSSIFPYIDIDGGDFHTIYVDSVINSSSLYTQSSTIFGGGIKTKNNNNNYYHIIPNTFHSQCIKPNNNNNISLTYEWKQLFISKSQNINISNKSILFDQNSKILSIPINQLNINEYYVFELTVFEQNKHYQSSKEIYVYTEYLMPIPLINTIQTINNEYYNGYQLNISIYDLFHFSKSQIDQNMYKINWFCFKNVFNPINCSQIIKNNNSDDQYQLTVDTISLSLNTKYRFECKI